MKYSNQYNLWTLFQFDWMNKLQKKWDKETGTLTIIHDFKKTFSCGYAIVLSFPIVI